MKTPNWKISILLVATIIIVGHLSIFFVEINNSPSSYLPDDMPSNVVDNRVREEFSSDQTFIFMLESESLYSQKILSGLKGFTDDVSDHEFVTRVRAVTSQERVFSEGEDLIIEDLVTEEEIEDPNQKRILQKIFNDRFAGGVIASEKALGILVQPILLDDSVKRLDLEKFLEEMLVKHELTEYRTATTGFLAVDLAEYRSMFDDSIAFIPFSIFLGMLTMWLLFRKWIPIIIIGLSSMVGISLVFLCFALLKLPYNLVGVMLPTLMVALTTAALIHLFSAIKKLSQEGITENLHKKAVDLVRKPTFFSLLTTSVGLFSLAANPVPPMRNFGFVGSGILLLMYFIIFYLMIPIIEKFDKSPWSYKRKEGGLVDKVANGLGDFSIKNRKWLIPLAPVFFVISILLMTNIRVETNFLKFFKESHPINISTKAFENEFLGTASLEIYLESERSESLKDLEVFSNLQVLKRKLENHELIDKSFSYADFVEVIDESYGGDGQKLTQEEIDQYLLIYDGTDMYDFVDRAMSKGRVTLSVNNHSTSRIRETVEFAEGELGKMNWPSDVKWHVVGSGRSISDLQGLLVEGQIKSIIWALIIITLLLCFLWRSVPEALLSMIPNIAPVAFTFGLMGLLDIPLDMGTALIASVTVGIAIDDSIHLFFNIRRFSQEAKDKLLGIKKAVAHTGVAIIATTLILCAQFGIYSMSAFVPTIYFGVLSLTGLLSAVLFDLIFFPGLIYSFWKPKSAADLKN